MGNIMAEAEAEWSYHIFLWKAEFSMLTCLTSYFQCPMTIKLNGEQNVPFPRNLCDLISGILLQQCEVRIYYRWSTTSESVGGKKVPEAHWFVSLPRRGPSATLHVHAHIYGELAQIHPSSMKSSMMGEYWHSEADIWVVRAFYFSWYAWIVS